MNILIDPGAYYCGNVGDLAMLQAAIERLRRLWPEATIYVVTEAPARLQSHCPGVLPVPVAGRTAFVSYHVFGRLNRLLPLRARNTLARAERHLQRQWPAALAALIAGKRALAGRTNPAAPRTYVDAMRHADLVLASGAGQFTDPFADNAMGVMATLELAADWNIPTAVLGQGFGPVEDETLLRRMACVLPRVDLIAIREKRESARLLESVGVSPDRIFVTGDDTIETAHGRTPAEMGREIGVNIRVASFAGVNGSAIDTVRPVLHQAASRFGARLIPVPIAHHSDRSDMVTIRQLIAGYPQPDSFTDCDPGTIMSEVSRCRIVVTGSYHAAVVALAQGIPVVSMVGSRDYRDKFAGLADLFGGGCELVDLDAQEARGALVREIERLWAEAPRWREPLLRAASKQIEWGKAAYQRVGALADARLAAGVSSGYLGPSSVTADAS